MFCRLPLLCILLFLGCGSPTPPAAQSGPPAPPPVAEQDPPPPPPPVPDRMEKVMAEATGIIQRYAAATAKVKDEATADKAAKEIGQLTARLGELAKEAEKLPYRPGQEKHSLALQTELTRLQTAPPPANLEQVLSDPDLILKLVAVQQSFVTQGLLPFGQALAARQPSPPEQSPAPEKSSPAR